MESFFGREGGAVHESGSRRAPKSVECWLTINSEVPIQPSDDHSLPLNGRLDSLVGDVLIPCRCRISAETATKAKPESKFARRFGIQIASVTVLNRVRGTQVGGTRVRMDIPNGRNDPRMCTSVMWWYVGSGQFPDPAFRAGVRSLSAASSRRDVVSY